MKSTLWLIKALISAIVWDLLPAIVSLWKCLLAWIEWLFEKKGEGEPFTMSACVPINHPNYKRPDPLIYDQYYMMSLGLAVSWQNPDIEILQGGVPVSSSYDLQPAMKYTVRARIWNASPDAVCGDMPVVFSYLSFGVGTLSHAIGQIAVNLGAKGSASCPAYAEMEWTTPSTPGHYCLQVSFGWPDDLNPFNNLGQENTQVVQAASPGVFSFALRNASDEAKNFRFEADTFTIGPPPPCSDPRRSGKIATHKGVSSLTRSRNSREDNPLPIGWRVAFAPSTPSLAPGEQINVTVTVTPSDGFIGAQPINIHTFSGWTLIGGLTITLQRS
jgi:hypothetical protein